MTFHGRKVGLDVAPGRVPRGRRRRRGHRARARRDRARARRRARSSSSCRAKRPRDNKYTAGRVLVVGGAPGMTGAACLAAEAAFRADAGYVDRSPCRRRRCRCSRRRCWRPVKGRWSRGVRRGSRRRRARVALGPGLGRSDEAHALVARLLARPTRPVVVDADGLFGLEPFERAAPTVLTPHAGELARLLGEESAWVDAHRLEARAARRRALRLRRAAEGRRHARRRAGRGRARLRPRHAGARDGRHGRRAHGHRRARSSRRAWRRGSRPRRRGRRGAPRRSASSAAARRAGRERPARRAAARSLDGRCPLGDHDRPRRAPPERARAARRAAAARSSGRW